MSYTTARIHLRHPILGAIIRRISLPVMRGLGVISQFPSPNSHYARERRESLRRKLAAGETVYLLGLTPGGHNTGAALVQVSQERGIELLGNHEEERFRGQKHCMEYPAESIAVVQRQMRELGIGIADIHAVVAGWDYHMWAAMALECVAGELPGSLRLFRKDASPYMNAACVVQAFWAPIELKKAFKLDRRLPVINLRHHDNHAYFSYAVSPFGSCDEPVMILVVDGAGDDGAISSYVGQDGRIEQSYKNHSPWDSLGLMYGVLSSTQGGWPINHSEGRFMGAAAWGNMNRLTNPYYSKLREIFHFHGDGFVYLNRSLANWHRGYCASPYTARLSEILGPPIPLKSMWNPDAVLRVEDIDHVPITKERVDKAAAVQLVFEDALFHIIAHLIRKTGSTKLVLCGGAALNCVANSRIMEQFDEAWYERYCAKSGVRLHLWVPPIPNDEGIAAGAAYHFACLAGAPVGKAGTTLQHAFYCGLAPTKDEIERAIDSGDDIAFECLGNINSESERLRVAEFLAHIVSEDGVMGLFQGIAETGPRALGHRSILANPANRDTLKTLNSLVKFREIIRPLAPMATMHAAEQFFELCPGASDDDFNAYNYMVLTARAKPQAFAVIPAVIHRDGTCRVQIVRESIDPFCYEYLRAMGRRIGAEVSVNTSLNVGAPIAQTPEQALETMKRSKGMHGLLMIASDGTAYLAWHNVAIPPKDAGHRLRSWASVHGMGYE